MNSKSLKIFKVSEIKDWFYEESEIDMPPLQRNYIWRPFQAETLWDSLARGYPVGSFLITSNQEGTGHDLLDGQQRATTIALGFYNPWNTTDCEKNKKWRIKDIPILWFDLSSIGKKNDSLDRKYVFKLCTKSHPWGYQQNNNKETLSVKDIEDALNVYDLKDDVHYYDANILLDLWPWDADCPVPLCLILEAITEGTEVNWAEKLIEKCKCILPKIKTKQNKNNDKYQARVFEILENREMCKELFLIFKDIIEKEIPALILPKNYLKSLGEDSDSPSQELRDSSQDVVDEAANLFVRINSAGTALSGEELIYSIYKSKFPEVKTLIESSNCTYISPSKILSYGIKIVQASLQDREKHLPSKMRVKDFGKFISNEKNREELLSFIKSLEHKNIFVQAQNVLCGPHEFQLPFNVLVNIAEKSHEVFFILLYRLYRNDSFNLGSLKHKKVLGFITSLAWFGKGNSRNYDNVLRRVWQDLIELSEDDFWSPETMRTTLKAQRGKVSMQPLVPPVMLQNYLESEVLNKKLTFDELDSPLTKSKIGKFLLGYFGTTKKSDSAWDVFIDMLFYERGLILYSQRLYVKKWFLNPEEYGIEDKDVPWDWDHIHPQNKIPKEKNRNTEIIKEWHSSIGNLRAWPYELNRSDNDDHPAKKLQPDYNDKKIKKYLKTGEAFPASGIMFENEKYWKLRNDDELLKAIIGRFCGLYKVWYDELLISELFPIVKAFDHSDENNVNEIVKALTFQSFKAQVLENDIESVLIGVNHHGKTAINHFPFYYYIELAKGHFTDDENEKNLEIGLFVDTGDVAESVELLTSCQSHLSSQKVFQVFKTEDNKGAIISREVIFTNDIIKIKNEFEKFVIETKSIHLILSEK